MASGTQTTVFALSSGWVTITKTFLSPDLLHTYGASTMAWPQEKFYANVTGSKKITTSEKISRFVLRADETPLPFGNPVPPLSSTSTPSNESGTGNSVTISLASSSTEEVMGTTVAPLGATENGYVYPQFTLEKTTLCSNGIICFDSYTYSDPVNFAYEYQSLDSIVNYLTSSASWAVAGFLNCVSDQYIYDFSASTPYYKVQDKQLLKDDTGCFTHGRHHARFWVMANGRVIVGAHHEHVNYCFGIPCSGHIVDSWDGAENQLASDESGQFPNMVRADEYWLANNNFPDGSSCCQGVANDGYASTVTTTVTIQSYRTTDTYSRSHGLAVDQALPVPWWPPYQSGFEFRVTSASFSYARGLYLDKGSHYVEEASSGFVPNYAWHTKIFINGILKNEGDVGRYNHLTATFTV